MKKTKLLQSDISYLIARMRHKDRLVIGDAGLPVSDKVQQIDLAVSEGVPDFLTVLEAVLSEQKIEKVIMAEEFAHVSPQLHQKVIDLLFAMEQKEETELGVVYIPHETFKEETQRCVGAIRTGEFTPYANIILISGVVF
ncbi:D-ribose pyranase [Sinanaerobacter sp. ZZT-01]|uniref:D-ribose pyranase n=1 Tax=Sinanaerobacter sp. ZZT-01 TaxID=3111540 RepID=UPI002D79D07D|nr:D-ribose pyranase [Sinanaerobacter sp. ZZT-01]WRR95053.1 D-ribose pyranase [Sinanaerobacter sp. ZZT-01]